MLLMGAGGAVVPYDARGGTIRWPLLALAFANFIIGRLVNIQFFHLGSIMAMVFVFVGVFCGCFSWPFRDTVYFIVVTSTTVGYGDVLPLTDAEKIVTIFTMIISTVLMGQILSGAVDLYVVDILEEQIKKKIIASATYVHMCDLEVTTTRRPSSTCRERADFLTLSAYTPGQRRATARSTRLSTPFSSCCSCRRSTASFLSPSRSASESLMRTAAGSSMSVSKCRRRTAGRKTRSA